MSVLENTSSMRRLEKSMSSTITSWAPRVDQSIKIFLDSRNGNREGVCLVFVGGCDTMCEIVKCVCACTMNVCTLIRLDRGFNVQENTSFLRKAIST